jgi:hypothetical protein
MEMLKTSKLEMPKMILATAGGGYLGYYLAKGKSKNTQIAYSILGIIGGFALYKSFLQSPPKVITDIPTDEPATENVPVRDMPNPNEMNTQTT